MLNEKFKLTKKDDEMWKLIGKTDQKTLGIWAKECAEKLLSIFEENYADDKRPREALEKLQEWIETGEFSMKVIRKASLEAHKSAKKIGNDTPQASVAHACGQAVATAHVKTHAYGPAIYGQQAVWRMKKSMDEVQKERDWQYGELLKLRNAR